MLFDAFSGDKMINDFLTSLPLSPQRTQRVCLNQSNQETKELEDEITERKRAEEKLREREERKDLMLRTMPSALFTVDLNRRITSWNKKAEDITGLKAEEVIGKDCIVAMNCDACKKGCSLFDDSIEKPIYGKECTMGINGKLLTILKNADIFRDSQGIVLGGLESFIDVTEQKRAEEALKKKNEELARFNKQAVDRELKMVELKKEINALREELGKEPRYKNAINYKESESK